MNREKLEELKRYRSMLYVIDALVGFMIKGNLADEKIRKITPEIVKLIEKQLKEEEGVSLVGDAHSRDCVEFKFFNPHSIIGTPEVLFVPELQVYEKESLIYHKNNNNALFAPNMMKDIDRMKNLQEVIVCGCYTDYCVLDFIVALRHYFNQYNRDVAIFAVKNAMDTFDSPDHDKNKATEMAYYLMERAGIILVDDINELIKREKEMGLILRKERR